MCKPMDDVQFLQHLEAMGAARGLKPASLWEMSGVDRTIWGRVKAGKRQSLSRQNFTKLQKFEDALKAMPLQPTNGEVVR